MLQLYHHGPRAHEAGTTGVWDDNSAIMLAAPDALFDDTGDRLIVVENADVGERTHFAFITKSGRRLYTEQFTEGGQEWRSDALPEAVRLWGDRTPRDAAESYENVIAIEV